MQYNSWLYLVLFLGCTVLLYYALPLRRRWAVLLAASVVFYLISSRWLIFVLIASAVLIYWGALRIDAKKQEFQQQKGAMDKQQRKQYKARMNTQNKHIVIVVCVTAFGILFFAKYFNFVGDNLNLLLKQIGLTQQIPTLHLLMPLGISFYTLSAVSYLVDVSRGTSKPQTNFFKLLLFLMFFPVITEGPISRYEQLGTQLAEGHAFDYKRFCFGMQLIVWGLFQKVVLADRVNPFVRNMFRDHTSYSGAVIVLTVMVYTFQIYMDFAGCIDIARGSAELFGIELAPNFQRPFFAKSVNDFWRRWHITLGAWLRDYIFYPISLSRPFQTLSRHSRKYLSDYYAATVPALVALLAVWLGNGIWHGAAWKYICYGLYYYAITAFGMLLEPLFVRVLHVLHLSREQKGYQLWQILRTFCLVNIGMLLFRAKDLPTAWSMFCSIFQPASGTQSVMRIFSAQGLPISQLAIVLFGVVLVFAVGMLQERGIRVRELLAARPLPIRWTIYIGAVVFVVVLGAYGPGYGIVDFIYAQF